MLSLCMTQCVLGFYENEVVSASKAKDIDKGLLTFLFFIKLLVQKKKKKNQQCRKRQSESALLVKYVYTYTTRNWVLSLKQHV